MPHHCYSFGLVRVLIINTLEFDRYCYCRFFNQRNAYYIQYLSLLDQSLEKQVTRVLDFNELVTYSLFSHSRAMITVNSTLKMVLVIQVPRHITR